MPSTTIFFVFTVASFVTLTSAKIHTYSVDDFHLTFDDRTKNCNRATERRLVEVFLKIYPKLVSKYNPAASKSVTFVIDPELRSPNIPAVTEGNVVRFSPYYLAAHSKDVDVVTHECMHIVQGYTDPVVLKAGWPVEGIADYVRYSMGVDNRDAGWALPSFHNSQKYTDGGTITARFFAWIEKKVKKGFVMAYDAALRTNTHNGFFKRFTGKTPDELWQDYAKNPKL